MPDLRSFQDTGSSYFFTIRLAFGLDGLLTRRIGDLRQAMRHTLARHPFRIDAIAVLPDVIHTLWTLPEGDNGYANRIGMLKGRFSRMQQMPIHRTPGQIRRGEKGIWQRRYWEHRILDQQDFDRHRDLIHLSPVHAGLCVRPQDWQFSSVHRDLRKGAVTRTLSAPQPKSGADRTPQQEISQEFVLLES